MLMPEEGSPHSLADEVRSRLARTESTGARVGLALMAVAAIVLVESTGILSGRVLVAAVLVVAGVALLNRPAE
jgi:hypothetical protein